jgi:hypothetical protein
VVTVDLVAKVALDDPARGGVREALGELREVTRERLDLAPVLPRVGAEVLECQ